MNIKEVLDSADSNLLSEGFVKSRGPNWTKYSIDCNIIVNRKASILFKNLDGERSVEGRVMVKQLNASKVEITYNKTFSTKHDDIFCNDVKYVVSGVLAAHYSRMTKDCRETFRFNTDPKLKACIVAIKANVKLPTGYSYTTVASYSGITYYSVSPPIGDVFVLALS